jgi:AraC-like DNA-binding protein/mannose-6-phosphate isomerase-like protein (cupin superfamily)
MSVAKLPIAPLLDYGRVADPRRPILTMSYRLGPSRTPVHRHSRAHLFYCTRGVFRVRGRDATWVVPPTQAVWIPSSVDHGVYSFQPIELLSLFIDASATAGLPGSCLVVDVPPLLRELFLRAVEIGNDYPPEGSAARLLGVILDRLHELKAAPLSLPSARDKRLRRLTDALLADPADPRGLKEWASFVGASVRTLERQFSSETGLSFAAWRRQLRLLEAIERLGKGQSVTRVALDLGYQSPSAFIAMFRRTLGAPPGHYFHNVRLAED